MEMVAELSCGRRGWFGKGSGRKSFNGAFTRRRIMVDKKRARKSLRNLLRRKKKDKFDLSRYQFNQETIGYLNYLLSGLERMS
jgi:hypothetical protein